MKVGICVCEKIRSICTTFGCFKAFNNKEKAFEQYKCEDELQLKSFFMCDICSAGTDKNLLSKLDSFSKSDAQNLHLGVCVCKCEAGRFDEIKKILEDKNIEFVEGTH